jgi:mevalonate kinase
LFTHIREERKNTVKKFSAQSSAPGKAILFGEHAVVYDQPAIAVPVTQVQARAYVEPAPADSGLILIAADLDESYHLTSAGPDRPLAFAARLTLDHLAAPIPDATLTVESTIPIASGLGSGAAVSTALVRALASFLGHSLPAAEVSDLVYEVEKIHHGTPSGIDNTVIAYERPVYFVRTAGSSLTLIAVGAPFSLVIADTGLPSPTRCLVDRVRQGWQRNRPRYERLFTKVGDIVREARRVIELGAVDALGPLMDDNHRYLAAMGVSSPLLDRLANAARAAGAAGAKLSGAGSGGNVLALAGNDKLDRVDAALREAGAVRTIQTTVS